MSKQYFCLVCLQINQKLITNKCHISISAMKLLIILTFCLSFVVCQDMAPSAPFASGNAHSPPLKSTHSPAIHGSGPEDSLSEYITCIRKL